MFGLAACARCSSVLRPWNFVILQESVWVSIFALVLAAISFCVTLVHTRRTDRDNRRPVLVFTYHREGWHIVNVGYGPALDVLFHRLVTAPGIQDNIRLPALSSDDKLKLKMCLHLPKQRFAATYRDMDGNEYSTRSQHDVSRTKRGFDGIVRLNEGEQIDSIRRWWQQDTILSDHKYARAEGC